MRALIMPVMLATLASAWALPAKADTITFNPTGGGAGAGAVSGISGFNYASSSVLAFGLSTPTVGATFPVYYESVLDGTQGTGVTVGPDFNINGSGHQFTVIAGFEETITAITPVGAGALISFTLASSPSTPNFFEMFANTPGSASPTTGNGAGFSLGTLVLSGTVSSSNFNGSFLTNGTTGPFNTSGEPTTNPTTTTLNGGGGTALTVTNTVTFQNTGYFPTPISQLTFSTTNSLPFNAVAPLTGFYSTTGLSAPNLIDGVNFNTGTINAVNGQSLMFQSVANNGFVLVPEPASVIQAMTAAIAISSLAVLRRLRRHKRSAA
jgi:hypothetical protein